MSPFGYKNYVTQEELQYKAEKSLKKLKKKNPDIQPVIIEGREIAKTWWGKKWNENLESYADYSNRISRGKSYVKKNLVLDLTITKGTVIALVQGSRAAPYEVIIKIDSLKEKNWEKVREECNNSIESMEELVEGKFPKELERLFTEKKFGLFPSPEEIHFGCSCPDWANMCKHVAAVLYAIGARLDHDPMLFFGLRDIDSKGLVKRSMETRLENMLKNAGKKSSREIGDEDVFDIFGV